MKKNLKTSIKIFFSGALVALLFFELDWNFVANEIKNIQIQYLLFFLLFQAIAMLASAKKWVSISEYQQVTFPVWEGFKAYLTGTFINNFLPATIGGDIYRSLWLSRRTGEKRKAFSGVIFDRFTGLIMTLGLTLFGGFFVWQYIGGPLPHFLTVSYLATFGALVVLMSLIFLVPERSLVVLPWQKVRTLFEEALTYRNVRVWLEASWWSAIFIFFGLGVSNYFLFLALGYTLPFLPFFGLVCLMALYVSLPISINNIGIKEWAYGVLFVILGVSFEAAVTVALLSRFLQTGISLLALPAYLLEKKGRATDSLDSDRPSQNAMGVR